MMWLKKWTAQGGGFKICSHISLSYFPDPHPIMFTAAIILSSFYLKLGVHNFVTQKKDLRYTFFSFFFIKVTALLIVLEQNVS